MKNPTIRVQGKGSVSQTPDRIHIGFTISDRKKQFAEAIESCNERTDATRQAIVEVGLKESELKTISFNVRETTEYREGRHIQDGYEAVHVTILELPIDKPLIGRLLAAVISGKGKPSVKLTFTLSDAEGLKQKVLADAVANATRRAETIAKAAALRLGAIEHIEYGYAEIHISSSQGHMDAPRACPPKSIAPEMEPIDLKAEDTVTILWALVE